MSGVSAAVLAATPAAEFGRISLIRLVGVIHIIKQNRSRVWPPVFPLLIRSPISRFPPPVRSLPTSRFSAAGVSVTFASALASGFASVTFVSASAAASVTAAFAFGFARPLPIGFPLRTSFTNCETRSLAAHRGSPNGRFAPCQCGFFPRHRRRSDYKTDALDEPPAQRPTLVGDYDGIKRTLFRTAPR